MAMLNTQFDRQFRRAGVPGLLRAFGEDVTYYAKGVSGGRTVKAIVERQPMALLSEAEIQAQAITIQVENHDTRGISSSEIETASDEVDVQLRVGNKAQRRSVSRVIDDSGGMLTLLLI